MKLIKQVLGKKSFSLAKDAIKRIETGLKYDNNMASSSIAAFEDAISVLERAIKELKSEKPKMVKVTRKR